jgi:hypothetical protein
LEDLYAVQIKIYIIHSGENSCYVLQYYDTAQSDIWGTSFVGKNCLLFQGMSEPSWESGCLYVSGPQRVILARAKGKGRCNQDWPVATTGPENGNYSRVRRVKISLLQI